MKWLDAVSSNNTSLTSALNVTDAICKLSAHNPTVINIEDEYGNPVQALKLFESKLTDGSKVQTIVIYFDKEGA